MPTCPMCSADVDDLDNMDGHDMAKHPDEGTANPPTDDSTPKTA